MKRYWWPIVALAALVACESRAGVGTPPLPLGIAAIPQTVSHAPCTLNPALHAPLAGSPAIAIAFGQLLEDGTGTRSASPALVYKIGAGHKVFAAIGGIAKYYPSLPGLGKAIVVTNKNTFAQVLYGNLGRVTLALRKNDTAVVKHGMQIALTGKSNLAFEYAPNGNVVLAGMQVNPCGTSTGNGASGSIDVIPQQNVAVYLRFHTIAVNATALPTGAYPASSPDVDMTQPIAVTNVAKPAAVTATVYERSDVFDSYYVTLCGNAAFATGHARYAGPFPYDESNTSVVLAQPSLPPVVFFRDPGKYGTELTETLPPVYGHACPAPAPANVYVFKSQAYNWVGQTSYLWYSCSVASTATLSSDKPTVAIASPAAIIDLSAAPPAWPPPSPANRADIKAMGVGAANVTVTDQQCGADNNGAIAVTVNPTPTAAPVPTPAPNT